MWFRRAVRDKRLAQLTQRVQSTNLPRAQVITHTITCPSELTAVLRGMKVRVERVFADRKLAKNGGHIRRPLENI